MFWVMNKKPETNRTELAWQPELRPAIPTIYGPIEWRAFLRQLVEIDRLLLAGIESDFVREVCSALPTDCSQARRNFCAKNASLSLRVNLARKLLGLSARKFAMRAPADELLRWFLCVGPLELKATPSKSTVERCDKILPPERMDAFNRRLFAQCCDKQTARALGLGAPVEFTDAYIDATCLKATIHFPIDWVLLRDAARTLMKAVACIRRHGLRQRMPQEPLRFLGAMNKLAMAMSASARKPGAKKQRKKILRQMKTLTRTIESHARAHLKLLREARERTGLSEKQAAQIAARIERILEQLPAAIKQAHERIIGGRPVKNEDKILSLYEDGLSVLLRGKAGAQVEFGREMLLCETKQGLVADYALLEQGENANEAFRDNLDRLEAQGILPEAAWTDRGLNNQRNRKHLEQKGVRSGLCERDPAKLRERLENEEGYAEGLRRRGSTEARIAIIKNVFTGNPSKAKGSEHTRVALGWAVLAHNLWVLARIELARDETRKKKKRKPR